MINGIEVGGRVAIVDDTLSTGGAVIALVEAVTSAGGELVDIVCAVEKVGNNGFEHVLSETGLSVKTIVTIVVSEDGVSIV